MDGSSGILDNCRYVKERVKAWGYAYRMTNDTKWVDRTWQELQVRTQCKKFAPAAQLMLTVLLRTL